MTKKIFVINWKMYLTVQAVQTWVKSHIQELENILQNSENELIIAPSFESICCVSRYINNYSNIKLAAQDCSAEKLGAYTGQVSAASLKELECTYCLVGHSETRIYMRQNNNIIAKKVIILLENNIVPIICIGETAKEHAENKTLDILKHQIIFILKLLEKNKVTGKTLFFAYEPVWAVGTEYIPEVYDLNIIFNFIKNYILTFNLSINFKLLYGGNVNINTINFMQDVHNLDGYLIGRASLDFQVLKKIVLY